MENINTNDTMPNTTSCVSASPDVRQAPAEAPQPTKAAKKRMRKATKAALAKVTDGLKDMKAVPLNGDTLAEAKQADEATARREFIKSVNADAAAVAEKWLKYGELCEAEDEAKQKRTVFRESFEGDAALRKRWQNVRDFFVTKKTHEFVTGKDGTQYFTLPEWCKGECGVTYEYLRRLDPRYTKLKNQIEGTKLEGSGKPRVSPSDSPSGKVNVDELPEDARKKVLAAISGTETTIDIPTAKGESHDAFTHEAPLTASVDEKVQAAFAYVEAKYARLMSIDEKEDFYFRLSKKFYDWDVPAAPQPQAIAAQAREDYTEEEVAAMFAGEEK